MEIAEKKCVKKRAGETNIETFMTIYQCAFHLRFHLDMWHNVLWDWFVFGGLLVERNAALLWQLWCDAIGVRDLLSNRVVEGICGMTWRNMEGWDAEPEWGFIAISNEEEIPFNRKTHAHAACLHIWHLVVAHGWAGLLLKKERYI